MRSEKLGFRLVRRRWFGDLTIAKGAVERGKDNEWGYELRGADGSVCAFSTRRYGTSQEAFDDLRVDFPALRVVRS
ncbi:MAG: hypothetical protein F4000_12520 [Holophagales bacterium]|nr:hypothetical protein [Holophagales bacterium]